MRVFESSLCFGEYEEDRFFHIEKSNTYKSLGGDLKTVEFILCHNENKIWMIEAKSSSPKPNNEVDFDKFINEIVQKFSDSIELFFSLVCERQFNVEDEMPDVFKKTSYPDIEIKLLIVIVGHKIEWLSPIRDSLKRSLSKKIKIWNLDLIAINEEQAKDYGLLC